MKTFEISYHLGSRSISEGGVAGPLQGDSYIYRTSVQAPDINMAQRIVINQNGGPDKCWIGNIREV